MRILFCTNSLGAMGGLERVTIVKANALADIEGNEVAVAYTDRGTYPEKTIHPVSEKVKVIDLGVTFWDLTPLNLHTILVKAPKKFASLRKRIKKVIGEFRPDVVITTGSYEKFALASLHLNDTVKVREFHFNSTYRRYVSSSPLMRVSEWVEYKLLHRCFDMNFLLTREDLTANFSGAKNTDYQYNPCTFDTARTTTEINSRDNTVVAVGRLNPEKNVAALINAWAKAVERMPGWRLKIVGDGSQRQRLVDQAVDLGVADSVDFFGFRNDVADIISRAKIMATTSKFEGFGLNIVEAMAMGTVPVSYAFPYGAREIINDGIDGIIAEYNDVDDLAHKLADLANDPDRLAKLSSGAKRRAHDFDKDKIIAQLMDKYQRLISSKRKS